MNKKLTKLLSVFLIAGLIGAGTAVGVAGCKKNNNNNNNQTQTEHDITWNMGGHGTAPTTTQTSGGKVTRPAEDPTDTDYDFGGWYTDDTYATEFDFATAVTGDVTVYAKWTPKATTGEEINLFKEWVNADADNAIDNGGKKYLAEGDKIFGAEDDTATIAGADLEIEGNKKKSIIYQGQKKDVTCRVKFGGNLYNDVAATDTAEAYKALNKGIKVRVAKASTIVIYGTAGGSNKKAFISLAEGVTEGEGATAVTKLTVKATQQICWKNGDMNAVIFELEANKDYYIGSDNKGDTENNTSAVMYLMEIKSTFDEGKGELVQAKTANCTEDGNVVHYYTQYGRYLDQDGTTVLDPNEVFSTKLGHKWTYTTVTAPTADAAGSVTLTCANDSTHTQNVALPKLKSGAYKREEISGDTANYKYTLTYADVYEGETELDGIVFTAAKVEEAPTAFVDISEIETTFEEGDAIDSASSTPEAVGNGTLKLTAGTNKGGEMGTDKSLNVDFFDGKVNMKDNEGTNILYASLGFYNGDTLAPKTSGSYRVSGKLNATSAGSWDPVQIVTDTSITQDDNNDGRILFSLSSSSNKKYCMRFDGVRREESSIVVNDSDQYFFRIDVDLDNHIGTISLSPDGIDWAEIDTVTDPSINTFAGIRFQTGSGSRSFSVEQIKVEQKIEVDEFVGNYQMIERVYNYGVDSLVKTDLQTIKVNHDNTYSITMSIMGTPVTVNGTWTKGAEYYTVNIPASTAAGIPAMTWYAKPGAERGIMYLYQSTEAVAANQIQGAFIFDDKAVDATLKAALDAANYMVLAPGEYENPKVIAGLSATAITDTYADDPIFYQYKNTTTAAVKVTVVSGANTLVSKQGSTAGSFTGLDESESFNIAAGETVVLHISATTGTAVSFTFREYDPDTDEGVRYTITFEYGDGTEQTNPAPVETGTDGKLAELPADPTPKSQAWQFLGWFTMIGETETKVETATLADLVFTANAEIYAKWSIAPTVFAAQNNTTDFSALGVSTDGTSLKQSNFDGTENKWIKVVGDAKWKTGNLIEMKGEALKVYFGAAGTLTLSAMSTGSTNKSVIGLKDSTGAYVNGTIATGAEDKVTKITAVDAISGVTYKEGEIGAYQVVGQEAKDITFTIENAGWYTIVVSTETQNRGARLSAIAQTVGEYTVNTEVVAPTVTVETAVTVAEQQSKDMTYTVTAPDGVYVKEVNWSTSVEEAVATVDAKTGKISVKQKGAADTFEVSLSITDSLNRTVNKVITVTVRHVAATGVNITTEPATLKYGDEKQLAYEVTTAEGTATDVKTVIWNSSNPEVATVSDTGLVKIVAPGQANITVKIETLSGEEFTSTAWAIDVAEVVANTISIDETATINIGGKKLLTATVGPEGASGYTVTYEITEGNEFVTLDETTGLVTGVATGTATITATLSDGKGATYNDTCTVTVTNVHEANYVYTASAEGTASSEWATAGDPAYGSAQSADTPKVKGLELTSAKSLTLTATGNKVTFTITGFTNGSGKASQYLNVEILGADGTTVVKTVNLLTPVDKKNGKYTEKDTGKTEITVEMETGVTFSAIRLVGKEAAKNAIIVVADITVFS